MTNYFRHSKRQKKSKRLDTISVSGEAEGGLIRVVATANKEIKEITIDPVFLSNADKEELEELLVVALNKAIAQAENISQAEMQAASKDMLGGLGGLFNQ
ncbi:YbaB/EbfC family nucleoid-associated protein [Sphingobacterium sp. E70]|uniref:YbaB/EbfC family nucleoid-associated protein n=1 Tax=Sphingobacterium sp. E70 TaxID=2853439 RepID=UPI002795924B|nr:YbaB/EbfC family nucleoid-associated protein [Sphingobacterium sp. E70]